MMNFPGVMAGDEEVLDKVRLFGNSVVDGHAPGLSGKALNAYAAAGIRSDHESTGLEEARNKLARGLYVMVREGSSERNLDDLLPLVDEDTYRRCLLVVDDRSCVDLLVDGDVDGVVRKAVSRGLEPVRAIQMATLNPAEHFRLHRLGAVAPGYRANLVVLDDLSSLVVSMVFYGGRLVARDGVLLEDLPAPRVEGLDNTVRIKPFSMDALVLRTEEDVFPVIEAVPGQIVTRKRMEKVGKRGNVVLPDPQRDILKLLVVERHRGTGNMGLGLVTGFGLRRGAMGSSVAHDSHNMVVVGCDDGDIMAVVREIERLQGGLVVCSGGKVVTSLPLPVGGLMSDRPLEEVAEGFRKVDAAARELGTTLPAPFATLSFMALPVIPELKLTDLGLVDVVQFRLLRA
jgi:adenine deaminase